MYKAYPRSQKRSIDWVMDWSCTSLNWYNSFYTHKHIFSQFLGDHEEKRYNRQRSVINGGGLCGPIDMRTESHKVEYHFARSSNVSPINNNKLSNQSPLTKQLELTPNSSKFHQIKAS